MSWVTRKRFLIKFFSDFLFPSQMCKRFLFLSIFFFYVIPVCNKFELMEIFAFIPVTENPFRLQQRFFTNFSLSEKNIWRCLRFWFRKLCIVNISASDGPGGNGCKRRRGRKWKEGCRGQLPLLHMKSFLASLGNVFNKKIRCFFP